MDTFDDMRPTGGAPPAGALRRPPTPLTLAAGCVGVAALVVAFDSASDYAQGLLVLICIYATINVAWNLVLGFGGMFVFGQLAFFAIGGYTTAMLALETGVPALPATLASVAAAALAGAAIGLPSLRLVGLYLVLFTLAFQVLLQVLLVSDTQGTFGGALGFQGVAPFELWGLAPGTVNLLVALGMLAIALLVVTWMLRSPLGVAIQALRDNEQVATSRGVARVRHRMILFVASAAITGLAGAFYARYYTVITPSVLDLELGVKLLAMIVIGGVASTPGVIAGTALVVLLDDRLATQQQYSAVLWGAVIVATVLLMPQGLAGVVRSVRSRATSLLDGWFEDERTDGGIGSDVRT